MRGRSRNKSIRGHLTKSSRLVNFCSSWNSFYGFDSGVKAHLPLITTSSPTCPSGPFHSPLFYLFWTSLFCSLLSCNSLCVVGQKLLQTEGVFLLRVDWVPPAPWKVHPRVVLCQFVHIPRVCHHLGIRKKKTSWQLQLIIYLILNNKNDLNTLWKTNQNKNCWHFWLPIMYFSSMYH